MRYGLRLVVALTLASSTTLAAERNTPGDKAAQTASQERLDTVIVTGARARDALALDSVATTGSRLGLTARELPASVSVVTQELIDLRGARTAVEAIEAAVGMTGGISVGSIPNYNAWVRR